MPSLQRLLATSVVETLERRLHLTVAAGGTDALGAELERIVTDTLQTMAPALAPDDPAVADVARQRGILSGLAKRLSHQVLVSDHVDDIFADDRTLRRDTLRALHETLERLNRGEAELDPQPDHGVVERLTRSLPPPDSRPSSRWSSLPPPSSTSSERGSGYGAARELPSATGSGDEHVDYFLGTLERALAVLDEEGEGPASEPVGLRFATPPPPPPPARARAAAAKPCVAAGRLPSAAPRRSKARGTPEPRMAPAPLGGLRHERAGGQTDWSPVAPATKRCAQSSARSRLAQPDGPAWPARPGAPPEPRRIRRAQGRSTKR